MKTSFPCAACEKPVTYSASKCPACGHVITDSDIEARRDASKSGAGWLLGCIGVLACMALAVYVVANAGPDEEERGASDREFAEQYELKERNARYACHEMSVAAACDQVEENAELARYYRQRADEADGRQ